TRRRWAGWHRLRDVSALTQYNKKDSGQGGDAPTDQVAYAYDGWGNLTDFQQDNDGLVTGTGSGGGSNDYDVRYAYSTVSTTSGVSGTRRAAIRRTSTVLRYAGGAGAAYGSAVHGWRYEYLNSSSGETLLDGDSGYLTRLYKTADDGGSEVQLAEYRYGGDGRLLTKYIPVPELTNRHYVPSGGDPYSPYLDRWGRETSSQWLHTGGGKVYEATPVYDESSNITSVPQYHTPYGAVYGSDNLNRLVGAKVGVVSSGAISGTVFAEEDWKAAGGGALSLSQTGNWTKYIRSKDGTADLTVDGTFRDNNQYTVRDVDGSGSTVLNYEVTHDNAGNLTDDDKPAGGGGGRTETAYGYRYAYDAWNRLRKVYDGNGQSGPLVKELRYNGLGHLIGEHVDTDSDGDVDGSDVWRYNQYNERWQLLACWKGSDAKPSEVYSFHNAGQDGGGGSSYIDGLICRDRDKDVDGSIVREERIYYVQNWRHDVVALVRADSSFASALVERIRYDAYGRPSSFNPADVGRQGGVIGPDASLDNNDVILGLTTGSLQWYTDFGSTGGLGLADGTYDTNDGIAFIDAYYNGGNGYGGGGFGVLSGSELDNRVGYAGYRWDPTLALGGSANGKPVWHVRNRVLDSTSGKWFQMDPIGYVDGANLYEYGLSEPSMSVDPSGLCSSCERADLINPYSDPLPTPVVACIPPLDGDRDPLQAGPNYQQRCDWLLRKIRNRQREIEERARKLFDDPRRLGPPWRPLNIHPTNPNGPSPIGIPNEDSWWWHVTRIFWLHLQLISEIIEYNQTCGGRGGIPIPVEYPYLKPSPTLRPLRNPLILTPIPEFIPGYGPVQIPNGSPSMPFPDMPFGPSGGTLILIPATEPWWHRIPRIIPAIPRLIFPVIPGPLIDPDFGLPNRPELFPTA
ncbi:MAG: RHS repeat-associated core domain-containing protein, partial [Gammaproteobacteria bacterium]|nr:RHS repeat-associated core domain-containing protein [Gammaproteobacteria bacterium]